MAYRNLEHSLMHPDDEPEFPDIAGMVNMDQPSASNIATQIWPYNRYTRAQNRRNLMLAPPSGAASAIAPQPGDDNSGAQLQSIARSLRLIAAPWIVMPPDGEPYRRTSGVALPAISATAFTDVVSFTVPPGRNGALRWLANVYVGGGFTDYSGDVVWRITRNNLSGTVGAAAERNFENITASLGTSANPGDLGENSPIRVFENDVITLQVRNNAVIVAGQLIGGLLGGHFYPRTWDDQFDREDQSLSW